MTNNQKAKLSVSNIIGIVLLIIFLLLDVVMWLGGESGGTDTDNPVESVVQEEDEHVLMVKNGTNSSYPGQTYGEAFEAYFGSPAWKYFKGVQEGPDEDGDGEPDWTKDDVDVVEFTGDCLYQDVDVKACIQFVLNDDDTFTATYLEFNEVPQSTIMLVGLIDDVFTGDGQEVTESETTELATTEEITELDTTKVGDDVDSSVFSGEWYNTINERCRMEIICQNDVMYDIQINWGSSAWDNSYWSFLAEYDEERGALVYTNGCYYEQHYNDDGSMNQTEIYTDGTGMIYIKDGVLYWQDDMDDAGSTSTFTRADGQSVSGTQELSEVDMEWYRTNKIFYNSATGSCLEVIYYDDGSLDFAFDGMTAIHYSADGMFGDSCTVSGTAIAYTCNASNAGTQIVYDSAVVPCITISGSAEYDGYYYVE